MIALVTKENKSYTIHLKRPYLNFLKKPLSVLSTQLKRLGKSSLLDVQPIRRAKNLEEVETLLQKDFTSFTEIDNSSYTYDTSH